MTPTIASILNFAGPDMIVVLVIVLLLFGAKKLPELARGMGRAVKEFGAARDELERELSQSAPESSDSQNYSMKKVKRHPHGDAIGRWLTFNRTPVPIVMLKGLACVAYPWLLILVRIAHYIDRPYTIGTFHSSRRR